MDCIIKIELYYKVMANVEIRICFHVSISTYSFIYFFKYVFLLPWIEYVSFDSFQKAFLKQYYKLINFFCQ